MDPPIQHRRQLSLRQRIWHLLDDPTSSHAAKVIAFVVLAMIVLSTAAFVVQTLPQFVWSTAPYWLAIEYSTITVFTLEFGLRLLCCPSLKKFVTTPLNIVDFLAILPFYIELAAGESASGSSAVVRIFRLVRIFRIFKVWAGRGGRSVFFTSARTCSLCCRAYYLLTRPALLATY